MPIEILRTLDDGRPVEVRIPLQISMESRFWPLEEPGTVEVAAGGEVLWDVSGVAADQRPRIRVVAVEPLAADDPPPTVLDPFETVERSGPTIRASISRWARGRYRYVVDVELADGELVPLDCSPAEMGGVDVSGPPTGA